MASLNSMLEVEISWLINWENELYSVINSDVSKRVLLIVEPIIGIKSHSSVSKL